MPGKQQKKARVTRREKKAQVASLVETANYSKDTIVAELNKYARYQRGDLDLKIEYQTSETISSEDMNEIFNLLQTNMETFYVNSDWGWSETKKKEELNDENAKYLIVRNSEGKIVAFTHFRFEVEVNYPILYCYELQITEEIQRKGLGKYLMNILLLIAYKFKLVKVILTVFTHHTVAINFYTKALGFRKDETCPYEEEEKCYIILSKSLDKSLISDIESTMNVK